MKTVIVSCHHCNKKFSKSLKRYNEYIKREWYFYCSSSCLSKSRKTGVEVKCSNPICNNKIYSSLKGHSPIYCSQTCAAKVNNSSRKTVKFCGNSNCRNLIKKKNKFCSAACLQQSRKIPNSYYLRKIADFKLKTGRLPVKREMNNTYSMIIKRFGAWNKAISLAGFEPNPVLFSKKYVSNDGHSCDSLAEKIIDDWLYARGIPHTRNNRYPGNHKLRVDFVSGEYWIEFFGLSGQLESYDELAVQKKRLAKKYKIKLISLYPSDLFPKLKLEEKLNPLMKRINGQ